MRYITVLKGTQPAGPPPEASWPRSWTSAREATGVGRAARQRRPRPQCRGRPGHRHGGELSVMDGPFAEAKEFISYAVYEVRSKEEAVEWTSRFMQLHADLWPGWQGECDVVKVMGPEDFGPPQ